jgi:hypothetical protein
MFHKTLRELGSRPRERGDFISTWKCSNALTGLQVEPSTQGTGSQAPIALTMLLSILRHVPQADL